jgi:hypothetical protein
VCPIDSTSDTGSDSTTYSHVDYCGNHPVNNDEDYCGNHPYKNGVQGLYPAKPMLTLLSPSDVEQGFFDEPTTMLSVHTYNEVLASSGGEDSNVVDTDADTLSVATSDVVEEKEEINYQQSQPIPSLADMYMDISDSESENGTPGETAVTPKTENQQLTVSISYIIG